MRVLPPFAVSTVDADAHPCRTLVDWMTRR